MSCLDDCCQQDEGTAPAQKSVPWSEIPDLEVPEEPPELQVNGLESMTSLAMSISASDERLGPLSPQTSLTRMVLPKSSISASLAKTDFAILRGITLRESLRQGGNLWRKDPQYLETKAREALYRRSRPAKQLDVFISHSWASKGRSKVLSLLMQSGCNHALLFWFLGVVLAAVLCYADVLPMSFTYSPGAADFNEDCPLGPWVMIFGFVGTFFGLMLSPYLPGCYMRDTCFIDVACIHQADQALTRRGIRGISGFLSVSKELRILWSPVYLSRLWCVFEVATYKKINPGGKVVLAPIFLETIVMLFYTTILLGSIVYWFIRGAGYTGFSLVALGLFLSILPFLVTIQLLRRNYVQKHELFSEFGKFDLDSVQCFSKSDHDFIHSAIAELYGSKEAFTSYVRGPLRQELLGPVTQSAGPEKYGLMMITPALSVVTDMVLALSKGGVPPDLVLVYVVCLGAVGLLLFSRSAFSLLVLLCDRFAEPLVQRWILLDYLQTFMIFLVFMFYFVFGGLCMQPFSSSRWEWVPGLVIGCAFLLMMVNWLQRKSDARRMMSKTSAV